LAQYSAQYSTQKLNIIVGNLYTTLGRGLLLRTYEIPGAIWETRGYRIRYGFYRDLKGVQVSFRTKNFELKALRGRVLDVALPPTLKDIERRPDLVEGGQFSYSFLKQKVGLIYMRHTNSSVHTNYSSLFYSGNFCKNLSFYGELATRLDTVGQLISFSDTSGFGAYASINYSYKRLGVSFELKDYKNMSIGAGITDPPSLVKEHSYRLLNRVTHIPDLTNESGYQVELFYRFKNNGMITVNNSLAKNEIGDNIYVYHEYYMEYQLPDLKRISGTIFVDFAVDPLVNEKQRYTTGLSANINHARFSSFIEAEIQYAQRTILETDSYINTYLAYTFSYGTKASVSAIIETTTDPFYVEVDKHRNYYPAISLTYQPDKRNRISVFVGKRRGGPACNAGVCYNVLDFEGFEVRLTSRF
jgi:hypothetical protein